MKKLQFIQKSRGQHWVGDGFQVHSLFTYSDVAQELSPFLLLDYAAPRDFPPTQQKLGVGEHPHRGFETVTIVYDGEVEHRDSTGAGGTIGPGEVQWMTAGAGIVHEEFHGREYAKRGGRFEMVQLWVNLPKKDKWVAPGYQGITEGTIPAVELPNGAGTVRVIAGQYKDAQGPARTHSPMNVWDIRLNAGARHEFTVKDGHTTAVMVLAGEVALASGETVRAAEIAVLDRAGDRFTLEARGSRGSHGSNAAKILFLGGEPLNEPIVGHGPFVMNTEAEIRQAFADYRAGKMGHLE